MIGNAAMYLIVFDLNIDIMNKLLTSPVLRTLAALCGSTAVVVSGAKAAPFTGGMNPSVMMITPEMERQIIFS